MRSYNTPDKIINVLLACLLAVSAVAFETLADPARVAASGGLSQNPTVLTGENNGDFFGNFVSSAGDVNGDGYSDVLVGANCWPATQCQGRAYLYMGGSGGISPTPALTLTGDMYADYFGGEVSALGDINHDGFADFSVSAPNFASEYGRVNIYLGSNGPISATPAWTLNGEAPGSKFGHSVASGDINGDGYIDVVIGAYAYGGFRGRAYVYMGDASGITTTPSITLTGENTSDFYGAYVVPADVNGDGYDDLVVAADCWPSGNCQGRAYVYAGSAGGLNSTPSLTLTGESNGDWFTSPVANAGDVNADGYDDIIIGAFGYASGASRGRAYLYLGGSGGLSAVPATVLTGENDADRFGYRVGTAGDVNGDGYADVVIGAYGFPGGEPCNTSTCKGRAYIYLGGPSGLDASPSIILTGENFGDHFGVSATTAGDVNGDGYSDVVIGADGESASNSPGHAYLYWGEPTASPVTLDLYLHGVGPTNNPPTLFLDNAFPTATTAKYKDSSGINFSGGNPWKTVGTWTATPALSNGTLTVLGELQTWLGLKNSDDQGTNFDLRIEAYKNSTLLASGETYCITGITRNPALAKEVVIALGSVSPAVFNGTTDVLSLKILTRIGTNGAGGFCGGHANAIGLRLYFDSTNRPSKLSATFGP